jgi:hypothetical protein
MAVSYAITAGDYSAYHVVAICDDFDMANAYAARLSDARVEEIPKITELPEPVDILRCRVNMLASGEVFNPEENIEKTWATETSAPPSSLYRVKRDSFYTDWPDFIAIQVTGTDHVRVRKVMSEALAETKANITEWIEHGVPTDKE